MTMLRADEQAYEMVERARLERKRVSELWQQHQRRVRRWNYALAVIVSLVLTLMAVLLGMWRVR